MARNREPVKPVEYESDSGEEEDEEGSSEEGDSEPEPEQTLTATQKKSHPQQTPPQKAPSSSEEEESGSETESESEGPDANSRPQASKPMEDTQKSSNEATKARSKPNAPEPFTPTKSAAAKRPAEDMAKDAKKSKKTAESETSEKKSVPFQRLWSEDDEIVILRGMVDYSKSDPLSDLGAFYDFIKNKLHIDVSRTQLQDKIRRLKKKYANNKSKVKDGEEMTFSKPHEQNAYDLSKMIWGKESGKDNGSVKVVGGQGMKSPMVVSGEGMKSLPKMQHFNSGATMEERMLIAGEEVFGLGRRLDGEQDWQKLRVKELQLFLKQLELRTAQTKLVLEAMKGKDH